MFWVEAFNEAAQKWIPVDPLVTNTINKAPKFEPPASDPLNNLSYVLAFEEDSSIQDVTRRYAKSYNSKTRKNRVECAKGGLAWFRRILKFYEKPFREDRDEIEDAELAAKEAAEPMPRNVQDFKDHPYYVLKRHLRSREVIHPEREMGKCSTGKTSTGNLEPVYRRRDVKEVKSADGWYRLGREVKVSEQPLKRSAPRRGRDAMEDADSDDEDRAGVGLYAAFQTEMYKAPPVVDGRVPKNGYGNLDIYVPSMVPKGGQHIAHPDGARAAKVLGIDYADAVTGFEFRGRHGTAVLKGVVVAAMYSEAVKEVIRGFDADRREEMESRRQALVLGMWRRMLVGLRIMQRVGTYDTEGEAVRHAAEIKEEVECEMDDYKQEEGEDEGGGFMPDADMEGIAEPTANRFQAEYGADVGFEGGGFVPEDGQDEEMNLEEGGGFVPDKDQDVSDGGAFIKSDTELDNSSAGGFIPGIAPSQADDQAGGFMLDETSERSSVTSGHAEERLWKSPTKLAEVSNGQSSLTYQNASPTGVQDSKSSERVIRDRTPQSNLDKHTNHNDQDEALQATLAASLKHPHSLSEQPSQSPSKSLASHSSAKSETINHMAPNHPPKSHALKQSAASIDDHEKREAVEEDGTVSSSKDKDVDMGNIEGEESELDRTSLLSHDPEDEDADPEWLVSGEE